MCASIRTETVAIVTASSRACPGLSFPVALEPREPRRHHQGMDRSAAAGSSDGTSTCRAGRDDYATGLTTMLLDLRCYLNGGSSNERSPPPGSRLRTLRNDRC